MKGDDEWWARKAKEATVKSLKDDGIMRPPNRVAEEFEDVVTTLEKKQWIAKEAKAVKSNGLLQADYKLAYKNEYDKFMKFLKDEKRRIIYHALKASLGDHYLSAAKVAIFANAASLLEEVNKFMPTETEARKATLISKFWAATFESEGENDIAVWINYISTSVHDLGKLGENISDASKVSRLQSSLPLGIFREYKIANSAKGLSYADAEEHLRAHAQIAEVAAQLKQLSSTRRHRAEGSVFGAAAQRRDMQQAACFDFANGVCDRGDSCRFSHSNTQEVPTCKHCNKRGHTQDNCWAKYPEKKGAQRSRKPRAALNQAPVKANGSVMQLIQDAVHNKRESVDLATLVDALKEQQRPARLFKITAVPASDSSEHPLDLADLVRTYRRGLRVESVDTDSEGVPELLSESSSDEDDEEESDANGDASSEEALAPGARSGFGLAMGTMMWSSQSQCESDVRRESLSELLVGFPATMRETIQSVQALPTADYSVDSPTVSESSFSASGCPSVSNADAQLPASTTSGSNISPVLPGVVLTLFDRGQNVSNSVPAKLSVSDSVIAATTDGMLTQEVVARHIQTVTVPNTGLFDTADDCARRVIMDIGLVNMLLGRVLAVKKPDRELICLDGGANLHIANNGKFCHDKVPSTMEVAGVLGSPTRCTGKGSLHLQPTDDLPAVVLH
jgi:hypothetical protein